MHKVHDIIKDQARANPNAPALIWGQQTLSFSQLYQNILNAQSTIIHNTRPGERVAILALNNPNYVALMYAVPAANRILVFINARLTPNEISQQLQQADAKLLIGDETLINKLSSKVKSTMSIVCFGTDYLAWLQQSPPTSITSTEKLEAISEIAWLMFTSGSTGLPKPAMLTHTSLLAALLSANAGRPVQKNDRYLYPFPLFHVSAHNVLHQHRHGAAVVLLSSFDAKTVLEQCQQHQVTTLSLAPTMISMLLNHPKFEATALAHVRTIGYGASAISLPLLEQVMALTDCGLSQGFGMTELSGSVAFLHAEDHRNAISTDNNNLRGRLSSVGKPVSGVEIQLLDDALQPVTNGEQGEIAVRGQQVFAGYWNMEEATKRTFHHDWLLTGDIGRFDEDGYLYIVDRKKDVIVSGGENISPREVESAFVDHPNIKQIIIFGLPDQHWGEAVTALIETHDGQVISDKELFGFCQSRIARYKTPKKFYFDTIPLNASGKVDKPTIKLRLTKD